MSDSAASNSGVRGLVARIAGSAEYSIAVALLAVCLVVGGALWWLQPKETETAAAPASSPSTPTAAAVDERAALDGWKRKLGEQFGAIDEQQRRRAADEEARRARQRAEEAATAEARRQAEQAAQARQQAEAKARALAAAPRPATPAPSATAPPRRQPVIVDAAIDWSSCRRPSYPSLSVDRGEEGVAAIAVDLDAAAQILQARVAQSSGYARLDRATLEAVRKCRFNPAREDGVAKAATAEVRFTWKLQN